MLPCPLCRIGGAAWPRSFVSLKAGFLQYSPRGRVCPQDLVSHFFTLILEFFTDRTMSVSSALPVTGCTASSPISTYLSLSWLSLPVYVIPECLVHHLALQGSPVESLISLC